MEYLRLQRPRRRRPLWVALLIAVGVHGILVLLALWLIPAPTLPPVSISLTTLPEPLPPLVTPTLEPAEPSATPSEMPPKATASTASDLDRNGAESRSGAEANAGSGRGMGEIVVEYFDDERRKSFRQPPDPSATPDDPVATASDSLDGIGRVGSGEPGDPIIPGSGGVDIGAVLKRDATVATAQIRAREGRIHPFLAGMKSTIERKWKPDYQDARVMEDPVSIPDPVCAKGQHDRYLAARVLAVYDKDGEPLSLIVHGATVERSIEVRIRNAVRYADIRGDVPAELLDERQVLRLAWNVYVDDYTGCNLIGEGATGTRRGLSYVVGIVELDGVY